MTPIRTITLGDGTTLGLHYGNGAMPPDHKGMSPASCSIWVLHDGQWWRPVRRSIHKAVSELAQCDSWAEVLTYDVVDSQPFAVAPK